MILTTETSTPRSEWIALPIAELLEEAQILTDICEEKSERVKAETEKV